MVRKYSAGPSALGSRLWDPILGQETLYRRRNRTRKEKYEAAKDQKPAAWNREPKAERLKPKACYFALAAIFLIMAKTSLRSLSFRFVE